MALTHAQAQENAYAHARLAARRRRVSSKVLDQLTFTLLFDTLLSLTFVSPCSLSCQRAFMGGFTEREIHRSLAGWPGTKVAKLTEGIKAKSKATLQTEQTVLSHPYK